jgi:galactoside O-acetyltransferase
MSQTPAILKLLLAGQRNSNAMEGLDMSNPFVRKFYQDEQLRDVGFRSLGENVAVHEDVVIHGVENILLGDNVRIDAFVTIIATGPVEIGSYVHIGSHSHLSGGGGICLGDFSAISQGVKIYSRSDDFSGKTLTNPTVPPEFAGVTGGKVTLGKHVIVGAGSIIMPGVTIGEGSSVGALSLVGGSLPPWGIYFGSPARKVGERSRDLLALERQLLAQRAA